MVAGVALERFPTVDQDEGAQMANVTYPPIDYQDLIYYSAPKQKAKAKNLEDIDPS